MTTAPLSATQRFGIVTGFLNAIRHRIANKLKPEPGNDVILAAQLAALLQSWEEQHALLHHLNDWMTTDDHRPLCDGDPEGTGRCACGLSLLTTILAETLR